ncbi:M16 family metallopeptidase [Psychroflexus halocasei]|uniref:Predicted Zn-dependent peptidase n=1 Tax=Psychroflexus halocasei TaxID=908615 RepID=A0A1H4BK56_9FLAO|nr:pitrilysin family protein [Psychroflexus halocasei]SEA48520.1 Predicted Zn-dependent peptidase [Psychroflexus halocasei]
MKFKILTLFIVCLIATNATAQIDRSTMPKPGPAPKINLGEPDQFSLSNGLEVLVVENNKLPRVSVRLMIDNKPYTADKPGTASLVSSLLGTGTKNISKDEFNEEIDFLGASVGFGSESAYASSLSKFFPRVMELMAEGALNPVFSQEEFESEKAKLIEGLKSNEKNVEAIGSRVSSALAYGKNHPYGQFTTPESVESITLADVKNMYRNYFSPKNAYMVVVGDISKKEVKKLVKEHFKNWKEETPPSESLPAVRDAQYTQINFVDMPNAVQSQIIVQNTVDLKMSDADYFPVIVANQILGGSFGSYLNMNLREDKGYTYGARSSIGSSRYAARFRASAGVRNAVTDSSVVEFVKEIKRIRTEDVDKDKLEDVKKKFAGSFVMQLENPSTVANYALNIKTKKLPEDFYETFLEKINAVTVADIKRVANKYLKVDNLRIIVTGKGSEVVENLEKVTVDGKRVPVLYYDKKANKIDKPEFTKPIPEGVDAASVYQNYIKAIGGKDKAENVNTVYLKGDATVPGATFQYQEKRTKSGKSSVELKMGGNTVQKMIFDGEKGYQVAQGQRMDYTEEQNMANKKIAGAVRELNVADGVELVAIESIDGQDAYAVKINETTKEFYSVETGLKIQTATTVEQMGQTATTTIDYSDYKEVKGIKFPFKLTQKVGPMEIEINIEEVKVNEGVSDKDFE